MAAKTGNNSCRHTFRKGM